MSEAFESVDEVEATQMEKSDVGSWSFRWRSTSDPGPEVLLLLCLYICSDVPVVLCQRKQVLSRVNTLEETKAGASNDTEQHNRVEATLSTLLYTTESLTWRKLHNTAISDEGGYRYYIRTNLGHVNAEFRINVTAVYSPPIITSEPTEIKDGGAADLYCRASGGYPAGTIHWFDQRNTNWTQNSRLQITQGHNGLFTLSSKLSFRSIDSTWGPFRCVVLNYRYEEEGASTTHLRREDHVWRLSRKKTAPGGTGRDWGMRGSPRSNLRADRDKGGGAADLYCRRRWIPAGTIHWFDQRNTNWNRIWLQITQGRRSLPVQQTEFKTIDTT
ncbi:muscle, skeletal receptor tyrosine-protein kinase-like isoform X1 [Clarias magur]|uniref:Muscle, skeletal receptor tyrosine-protein kinase-like isoform X1 n=1 Tax=Clarias magur TaxID=1594786 RepID=A0A8J4U1E2_CLAMG|nr:muscle, skeletal receptor tyrosine-protein kinase-like isoform X1 [Clarias magur]